MATASLVVGRLHDAGCTPALSGPKVPPGRSLGSRSRRRGPGPVSYLGQVISGAADVLAVPGAGVDHGLAYRGGLAAQLPPRSDRPPDDAADRGWSWVHP